MNRDGREEVEGDRNGRHVSGGQRFSEEEDGMERVGLRLQGGGRSAYVCSLLPGLRALFISGIKARRITFHSAG